MAPRFRIPNSASFHDWKAWAQALSNALDSEAGISGTLEPAPILLAHKIGGGNIGSERASVDGIVMFDPTLEQPVYSNRGVWVPLDGEAISYVVEDNVADGSFINDMNDTDYTGQDGAIGACSQCNPNTSTYYFHKDIVYKYTGPTPASYGAGCVDTATLDQFIIVGETDRVRWLNTWVTGTYDKNDMVRDGDWLMVANKQTTDRAAPQLAGDPQWDLADNPAWVTQNYTGAVRVGREYDVLVSSEVTGYQVWVPEVTADITFAIYLYAYPTGQPELATLVKQANPVFTAGQWNTVSIARSTVAAGTTFGIVLDSLNSSATTQPAGTPANWTRQANSNNGSPSSGGWNRSNSGGTLRVHEVTAGSVTVDLSAAIAGTTINIVSNSDVNSYITYTATSNVSFANNAYSWFVSETITGPSGEPPVGTSCTVTITIPVPSPTKYVELVGGNPSANSRGILEFDSTSQLSSEDNAYGVRVLYDSYILSADWDIAGFVGLGSGGGTGGGTAGEFIDLLDTPSSYLGETGKVASVRSDELGLEFVTQLPEAPQDDLTYGRRNGEWDEVVRTAGGSTVTGLLTCEVGSLVVESGLASTYAIQLVQTSPADSNDTSSIRQASNGRLLFYAGVDHTNNTISATVGLAGTSAPTISTIMTREKGDARYSPVAVNVSTADVSPFPVAIPRATGWHPIKSVTNAPTETGDYLVHVSLVVAFNRPNQTALVRLVGDYVSPEFRQSTNSDTDVIPINYTFVGTFGPLVTLALEVACEGQGGAVLTVLEALVRAEKVT